MGEVRCESDAATGWLARQLVDGERLEVDLGGTKFPDQGLTIDAIFAFASAGASGTYGGNAIAWLGKPEILSGDFSNAFTQSPAIITLKRTPGDVPVSQWTSRSVPSARMAGSRCRSALRRA